MPIKYLQIDSRDNLMVALANLDEGFKVSINDSEIILKEDVKAKHKFTMNDFEIGDELYMYGVLIGKATTTIKSGTAITVNNVKHASEDYKTVEQKYHWEAPNIEKFKNRTFNGYHRANGTVGTANYWLVIPLVFCENKNVDVLEEIFIESLGYQTQKDFEINTQALISKFKEGASEEDIYDTPIITTKEEIKKNRVFPNVDGIKFLRHDGGCGGTRQDSDALCRLLAGYITNPNVAGATVLSLGCQHAQIPILQEAIATNDPEFAKPVYYLEQQNISSEKQLIEEAVKHTFVGLTKANNIKRSPAPLSKLVLGLECGASDGFSGISANPALGYASDLLVALGGSPALSEFPELNGVEQELINRCETLEAASKFESIMRSYSDAAIAVGSGFENNPSPGNIKDGLITDAIKSAGAAKKGGTSPVTDVLDYTEQITKPGLNLLCTPGNDVESTTGLAGSGCTVIVFTTGLGTPTGNPIAPVIKLSSNTHLFQKMGNLMDLNAGSIISGEDSIGSMGEKILEFIIQVAGGEQETKANMNGQNDFIPWKRGISL
ncbi:UxaA family hydrolase [Maribacter sp. HTCC2170]|uniref:UxaA family hydrolase n=1 Tax=Maribacter sp. (strain HTCC2170 / KCCM 42371) TaxID=313603 RepID=UPI00006BD25F|nr:altronate dehydratase family protein [Maribacter sp. HTCC2170]EAR02288.1 altronate hydrolase [Maribacter sp. HTCC2170]